MALIPFLSSTLTDDTFHDMYLCCHEVNPQRADFAEKVADLIIQKRKAIAAENAQLYRKRGNIQLNQTIGDTHMLVADRINLTDWDEWDR